MALTRAFFRPPITADESTPALLNPPRNPIDELMPKPISCRATPFVVSADASSSTDTPVFCDSFVRMSITSTASSASSPYIAIADCTLSIEEETSVSFNSANLINDFDSSSRSSPYTSNLVATSPIACPAVSKSVGISVVILSRILP